MECGLEEPLLQNGFNLVIPEYDIIQSLISCKLPDIMAKTSKASHLGKAFNYPSAELEYSDLIFTFRLDKSLTNYSKFLNWLKANTLGKDRTNISEIVKINCFLSINNSPKRFSLEGCILSSLSQVLDFDITESKPVTISGSISVDEVFIK